MSWRNRGEVSLIILSALLFGASILGIGAGTAVKNNTQTSSSKAYSTDGRCNLSIKNGCYEGGCKDWEWCNPANSMCEWKPENIKGPTCKEQGSAPSLPTPTPNPVKPQVQQQTQPQQQAVGGTSGGSGCQAGGRTFPVGDCQKAGATWVKCEPANPQAKNIEWEGKPYTGWVPSSTDCTNTAVVQPTRTSKPTAVVNNSNVTNATPITLPFIRVVTIPAKRAMLYKFAAEKGQIIRISSKPVAPYVPSQPIAVTYITNAAGSIFNIKNGKYLHEAEIKETRNDYIINITADPNDKGAVAKIEITATNPSATTGAPTATTRLSPTPTSSPRSDPEVIFLTKWPDRFSSICMPEIVGDSIIYVPFSSTITLRWKDNASCKKSSHVAQQITIASYDGNVRFTPRALMTMPLAQNQLTYNLSIPELIQKKPEIATYPQIMVELHRCTNVSCSSHPGDTSIYFNIIPPKTTPTPTTTATPLTYNVTKAKIYIPNTSPTATELPFTGKVTIKRISSDKKYLEVLAYGRGTVWIERIAITDALPTTIPIAPASAFTPPTTGTVAPIPTPTSVGSTPTTSTVAPTVASTARKTVYVTRAPRYNDKGELGESPYTGNVQLIKKTADGKYVNVYFVRDRFNGWIPNTASTSPFLAGLPSATPSEFTPPTTGTTTTAPTPTSVTRAATTYTATGATGYDKNGGVITEAIYSGPIRITRKSIDGKYVKAVLINNENMEAWIATSTVSPAPGTEVRSGTRAEFTPPTTGTPSPTPTPLSVSTFTLKSRVEFVRYGHSAESSSIAEGSSVTILGRRYDGKFLVTDDKGNYGLATVSDIIVPKGKSLNRTYLPDAWVKNATLSADKSKIIVEICQSGRGSDLKIYDYTDAQNFFTAVPIGADGQPGAAVQTIAQINNPSGCTEVNITAPTTLTSMTSVEVLLERITDKDPSNNLKTFTLATTPAARTTTTPAPGSMVDVFKKIASAALQGKAASTPAPTPTAAAAKTGTSTFDCNTVTTIPVAECSALVDLYNSTKGDNWTNNSNWLKNPDPCTWYGVRCESNKLVQLFLPNNQLTGSIPANLGKLTNLQSLNLIINRLSGSIPPSLGNLTNLKSLGLHTNQLTGSIPASLGKLTNVQTLFLDHSICYPKELSSWYTSISNKQTINECKSVTILQTAQDFFSGILNRLRPATPTPTPALIITPIPTPIFKDRITLSASNSSTTLNGTVGKTTSAGTYVFHATPGQKIKIQLSSATGDATLGVNDENYFGYVITSMKKTEYTLDVPKEADYFIAISSPTDTTFSLTVTLLSPSSTTIVIPDSGPQVYLDDEQTNPIYTFDRNSMTISESSEDLTGIYVSVLGKLKIGSGVGYLIKTPKGEVYAVWDESIIRSDIEEYYNTMQTWNVTLR